MKQKNAIWSDETFLHSRHTIFSIQENTFPIDKNFTIVINYIRRTDLRKLSRSVGHRNLNSVVVSGQLFLVVHELAVPKLIFCQKIFSDSCHHKEDDSATDDQTDDENPVLPSHWNDAKSSYLEWNKLVKVSQILKRIWEKLFQLVECWNVIEENCFNQLKVEM